MDSVIDVYFEGEVEILVDDPAAFDQERAWEIFEANSVGLSEISKAG